MTRTQEHIEPNIDRQTTDKRTANALRFFVPSLAPRVVQALLLLLLLAPLPTCLPDSFAPLRPDAANSDNLPPADPLPLLTGATPKTSPPEKEVEVTLTGHNFRGKDNDTCAVSFWNTELKVKPPTVRADGGQEKLVFTLPKSTHPATALELTGQAVPIKVSCGRRTSAVNSDIFSYVRKPQRLLGNAGDKATSPALIRLKDLNNDNKPDLVVTTTNDQCRIFTLIGDGKGSFNANKDCKFATDREATVIALDVGRLSGALENDVVALVRTKDDRQYIDYLFDQNREYRQEINNDKKIHAGFLSGTTLNLSVSETSSGTHYLERRQWGGTLIGYGPPDRSLEIDSLASYYDKCGSVSGSMATYRAALQEDEIIFFDKEIMKAKSFKANQPQRIVCPSLMGDSSIYAAAVLGSPMNKILVGDLSTTSITTTEYQIPENQALKADLYIAVKSAKLNLDAENDLIVVSAAEPGKVLLLQSCLQPIPNCPEQRFETVTTNLGVHRDVEVADLNGDGLADVVLPGTDSDGKGGVFVYLSYRP